MGRIKSAVLAEGEGGNEGEDERKCEPMLGPVRQKTKSW